MMISYYVIIAYLSLYFIHFHCQNRVLIGEREKKEKNITIWPIFYKRNRWETKKIKKSINKIQKCFERIGQIVMPFLKKTAKLSCPLPTRKCIFFKCFLQSPNTLLRKKQKMEKTKSSNFQCTHREEEYCGGIDFST
jgi:hypothetical protein